MNKLQRIIICMFLMSILAICIYVPHKMVIVGRSDYHSVNSADKRMVISDEYFYIWEDKQANNVYTYKHLRTSIGNIDYSKMLHELVAIIAFYGLVYMLVTTFPILKYKPTKLIDWLCKPRKFMNWVERD